MQHQTEQLPRYYVAVRTTPRGAYRWGRPVYVAVVDREVVPEGKPLRDAGIVAYWGTRAHRERGQRLDARYDGPRSAYGQALREAEDQVAQLNTEAAR